MPSGLGFSYASDTELLLSPTLVMNENATPRQSNTQCQYHCHEFHSPEETDYLSTDYLCPPMEKDKSKLTGKRHLNLEVRCNL